MPYWNQFAAMGSLPDLKGVIFDCDGVMFDSKGANRAYYNLFRDRMGLEPMNAEEEVYVHCHAVKESLAYIIPESRWLEIPDVRAAIDYNQVLPHMRPEPGIFELLWGLRDAGLRLAVYTNRTTTMHQVLELFDLEHYFDHVMTPMRVRAKPHPEGMFKILSAWGLARNEVAYVGDSTVDARTAEASGVPFWAYKNETLSAQLHISDFWEFKRGLLGALDRARRDRNDDEQDFSA